MLDIRKLRMLAKLQRLGTIAAVADELHLSAPGVSTQLTALERDLGIQLTERQGRRLALTPAGEVLANRGHDILDRISLAELEVDALREGVVGRYAVTAFPSAARTFVADACRQILGDQASAIELYLTTTEPEQALDSLASGRADLAVVHSYSNVPRDIPRGLEARKIAAEPVWLAVRQSTTSAARPSDSLADYAQQGWITPTNEVTCFDMVERACGLAGFRPRVVAESMDFAVQLELVATGLGVALVPDLTFDRLPDDVELIRLRSPIERTIWLVTRAPGLADPALQFLAGVIEQSAAARLATRSLN